MKKELLSFSETGKHEYCATIVKIGEVTPIENSDKLGTTIVNGLTIVVRKDEIKEGDVCVYCANETELCDKFCSKNNLYDWSERFRNDNYTSVKELEQTNKDLAKTKVGFFNKYGRVKMIKLRGVYSMGILFKPEALGIVWDLSEYNFTEHIGEDFDTINDELFIKAYVPRIKEYTPRKSRDVKRNNKLRIFDKIIPGEFSFHYDTTQLQREISRLKPDDVVTISVKLHGTSICIGNVLTKQPVFITTCFNWLNNIFKKIYFRLPEKCQKTKEAYDVIYSSRTVIKNKNINETVTGGYYGTDIWGEYYELLKDKIPQGIEIYGEIVGYVSGENKFIQPGYDYGCSVGENKLMIYRISQKNEDGTKIEYNVEDVLKFTKELIATYPEIQSKIHLIDILYHGKMQDIYPSLSTKEHWHENILEKLKNDKALFGMEEPEPLCKNNVPREGIVLRIDNDIVNEAFKLKSLKFLYKEGESISKGNIDIEMENNNY